MDLGNVRLQEGILLDKSAFRIGVKGISNGAGASFASHYLDRALNERGRTRVFVSRPDKYIVFDSLFENEDVDIIVGIIDPLPSRLIEGAEMIEELLDQRTPVVWMITGTIRA